MTEKHSKSRQTAEIAFSATQSQFFAKDKAVEELNSIVQAREDKTLRLREARLAKELQGSLLQTEMQSSKRGKKASPAEQK